MRTKLLVILVFSWIPFPAFSDPDLSNWRFWTAEDGMVEDWTSFVGIGPGGNLWINHGSVNESSSFDGYRFQRFPSPGFWTTHQMLSQDGNPILEGEAGQLWSVGEKGIKQYQEGRWILHDQFQESSLFRMDDILDWSGFLSKLVQDASSTIPNPGKMISNLLSQEIGALIAHSPVAAHLPIEEKSKIINSLNKLVKQKNFFREQDFSTMNLSQEIITILTHYRDDDSLEKVQKRNRLLIEAVYPDEIKKRQFQFRQFLPYKKDQLFILRPDRLLIHNFENHVSTLIKYATETALCHFNDMVFAREGGLWITGETGFARFGYNDNRNQTENPWIDFLTDPKLNLHNFQFPLEGKKGELSSTAFTLDNQTKVSVHFDGNDWKILSAYKANNTPGKGVAWLDDIDNLWNIDNQKLYIQSEKEITTNGIRFEEYITQGKLASYINNITLEPNGVFWLSLWSGIGRYAPPLWKSHPVIGQAEIIGICEDLQGRLWLNGHEALFLLDHNQLIPFPFPESCRNQWFNHVTCLPNGSLAMHSINTYLPSQILTFDPVKQTYKVIPHPQGWHVHDLMKTQSGKVALLTYANFSEEAKAHYQIELFDGKNFEPLLKGNELDIGTYPVVYETTQGDFWILGRGGVAKYSQGQITRFRAKEGYPFQEMKGMVEIDPHTYWLVSTQCVYEYTPNAWRTINNDRRTIESIIKASDGSVWIAHGGGIMRYAQGSWVNYSPVEGLPDKSIYYLYEDRNSRIWCIPFHGGEIRFFDPAQDRDPPIAFWDLDNSNEIPPKGDARFQVSGLDKWKYTPADRLLYSHRLDGKDWSPFVANPVVSATGLAAGAHRIEVRPMDRNLNMGTPVAWDFKVLLPWYKEPFFLVLMLVSLSLILTLLTLHVRRDIQIERMVKVRTSHLEAANRELRESQASLQKLTSELATAEERERRKLAVDLHDSVSQYLSFSILELSLLHETSKQDEVQKLIPSIENRLNWALKSIRDLTFELYPPELYQIGLEEAVQELITQMENKHGIRIWFDETTSKISLPDDLRYFLFRVIRELLINITKHAQATEAKVTLRQDDSLIWVTVSDNGLGTSPEVINPQKKGGFGLFSIQERLQHLRGALEIESGDSKGTTITIRVPTHSPDEGNEHED